MNYLHKTLLPGETIEFDTHPHWIIFLSSIIVWIGASTLYGYAHFLLPPGLKIFSLSIRLFFFVMLYGYVAFIFSKALIHYFNSEYGITNKRVLIKTGFIQRDSLEIFLQKIEAVHVVQSIMGRIFNYGTIIIIGTGGSKDPFYNVPDPLKFRNMIQQSIK